MTEQATISIARERRKKLERDISELLKSFEKETGLKPTDVSISTTFGGSAFNLDWVNVSVKVEL